MFLSELIQATQKMIM